MAASFGTMSYTSKCLRQSDGQGSHFGLQKTGVVRPLPLHAHNANRSWYPFAGGQRLSENSGECTRTFPAPSPARISRRTAARPSPCPRTGTSRPARCDRAKQNSHLTLGRYFTRPPNPSTTFLTRAEGYTYAAKVWALSIVQGPFSVAPCQNPPIRKQTNRCPEWHKRRKAVPAPWPG